MFRYSFTLIVSHSTYVYRRVPVNLTLEEITPRWTSMPPGGVGGSRNIPSRFTLWKLRQAPALRGDPKNGCVVHTRYHRASHVTQNSFQRPVNHYLIVFLFLHQDCYLKVDKSLRSCLFSNRSQRIYQNIFPLLFK